VFAERVVVAGDALVPIPAGVDDRVAVLTEPLAASVSALRYAGVGPNDRVLVLGGGPIGLLAVHACVAAGIEVALVEPLNERRSIAADLGATATYVSADQAVELAVDLAIDAVGIEPTWQAAIASVRIGGAVTIVGLGQPEGVFPAGDMVRRAITVRGHYAYTRSDFDAALALLAEHTPSLEWLRLLPLAEGAEGFRLLVEEPAANIKILLEAG
jgi:(R,R)-butanediol dehydrogenase/meso-butanediol dehydrogenase/diacetyl reductase